MAGIHFVTEGLIRGQRERSTVEQYAQQLLIGATTMDGQAVLSFYDPENLAAVTTNQKPVEPPQSQWSLQRYWDEAAGPQLKAKLSPARVGEYRTYLKRWKAWWQSSEHWSAGPVLCEITPSVLADFHGFLRRSGVPAGAADKHCQGITAILRLAERSWIITRVPVLQKHADTSPEGSKWTFGRGDLDALYDAAAKAEWPPCFRGGGRLLRRPGDYWRAYIVGGWTYGFRPQEWWAYEQRRYEPLTWGNVQFHPAREIEHRVVENDHGWICWQQTKTGRWLVLPMSACLSSHLKAIEPVGGARPAARVFDFPLSAGTNKPGQQLRASSGWYAQWWAIVAAAGLRPEEAKGKRLNFRPSDFRNTAYTNYRQVVIHAGDPRRQRALGDDANWITGHSAGRNVGLRHYYNAVEDVQAAILALQPPSRFVAMEEQQQQQRLCGL